MQVSTDLLLERVTALVDVNGACLDDMPGDEVLAWLEKGGRAAQSLNALLATLTARLGALSSGEDRTRRFARTKGFADTAALVADVAQVPRSAASALLTLGEAMSDADEASGGKLTFGAETLGDEGLPLYGFLAQQVARGFSSEKAVIIRRTLKDIAMPTIEIERSLVERARKRSVPQVRAMCLREFARVDHDGYRARMLAQRADRYVKFWDGDDGMVNLHGKLDATTAIPLRTWIEDQVAKGMHTQRSAHPSEQLSPGALAADALAELALHRLGCQGDASGVKSTIVVQVPADELAEGSGTAFCHGYAGPICVEDLVAIAVDAQWMAALVGTRGLPLFLGRSDRLFTPAQRLAIAVRDGGCAQCGAPVARCHVHHIRWWSQGGTTDIDNGVLLCSGCHHRLHDHGWGIEIIDHEVWFIPPAEVDPRRERIPACLTRSTA